MKNFMEEVPNANYERFSEKNSLLKIIRFACAKKSVQISCKDRFIKTVSCRENGDRSRNSVRFMVIVKMLQTRKKIVKCLKIYMVNCLKQESVIVRGI